MEIIDDATHISHYYPKPNLRTSERDLETLGGFIVIIRMERIVR